MWNAITCPSCATSFWPVEDVRGKKLFCPMCGRPMVVTSAGIARRDEGGPVPLAALPSKGSFPWGWLAVVLLLGASVVGGALLGLRRPQTAGEDKPIATKTKGAEPAGTGDRLEVLETIDLASPSKPFSSPGLVSSVPLPAPPALDSAPPPEPKPAESPPVKPGTELTATWEGGLVRPKRVPPVVTNNKNALVQKYRARLRMTASSVWAGWPVENVLDGNIESSWFSEQYDAAALGRSPWVQAEFPERVSVTRVTILGNRDPAWLIGYTILEGRLTVSGAGGKVLRTITDKGVGNFRDFDYRFDPPLEGVRFIRFTSLKDQGNHTVHKDIALAEFQVDGFEE